MRKPILTLILCAAALTVAAQKDGKPKVYMVSNAHFDTQWNWTVQTSISDYLRNTLEQNFWLLERYPDYIFNFEGAVRYSWMKEYYPQHYQQVKRYVAQGRWHLAGASWDSTDPNIPSAESAIRNVLLGQQFFKEEFGLKSSDMFMPDCFGFGYTTPTVAAHCGLLGFSTQKLARRRVVPFDFGRNFPFHVGLWEGIDGQRICSVFHGGFYMTKWQGDLSANEDLVETVSQSVNGRAYRYYGTGDVGGAPTPLSVQLVQQAAADKDGAMEIINAASDQLYKDYLPYDAHPELPVFKGELLLDMHAAGCYTSQGAMKRYNRRNEQLGDAAERASVVAALLGGYDYPREKLTESWRRFLWHQFHDDLTGTSIPGAYNFSWNDELISQSQFADIITAATASVAARLDTRSAGVPVVVYNPLGCRHSDLITARVPFARRPASVKVTAPDGRSVAAQVAGWDGTHAEVTFSAQVTPVSFSVFDIRSGAALRQTIKASGNTIENAVYKVTLDEMGEITSILDKRYGREMVAAGKTFRLAVIEGNLSTVNPAWDITWETMQTPSVALGGKAQVSVAYCGPAAGALRVEREYKGSRIVQYIRLTAGAQDDRIDILTEIDWASVNVLLKAEFPTGVTNPRAAYDLGMGYIERVNNSALNHEVVAQQWASIAETDRSYAVTVTNDCKYGWDKPDDNTIRLTLMHSPQVGTQTSDKFKYQQRQDFGHHTITYSIIGHKGHAADCGIARAADRANNPLFAFTTSRHAGELGRAFSAVTLSDGEVDLKALKMAEDGRDMVVARFYQPTGREVEGAYAEFNFPIKRACTLDGIEEEKGAATHTAARLIIDATPFSPRTYGIEFAVAPSAKPVNTTVKLPYNDLFAIPDGYRGEKYKVDFDSAGNAYSADLLPAALLSEGVRFTLGDPARKSAVRCEGQGVEIPAGQTLYLLAASSAQDKTAVFSLGGKQYALNVPSWSGFYGQWGWDGAKTYVREATVAYVASHIHNKQTGAVPYVFGYMYKLAIPLDGQPATLTLPQDRDVVVFAATVSDADHTTKPAHEFRAI